MGFIDDLFLIGFYTFYGVVMLLTLLGLWYFAGMMGVVKHPKHFFRKLKHWLIDNKVIIYLVIAYIVIIAIALIIKNT